MHNCVTATINFPPLKLIPFLHLKSLEFPLELRVKLTETDISLINDCEDRQSAQYQIHRKTQ